MKNVVAQDLNPEVLVVGSQFLNHYTDCLDRLPNTIFQRLLKLTWYEEF